MKETLKNRELFHICTCPDFELTLNKSYNTDRIKRTYEKVCREKKEKEEEFEKYRNSYCLDLPKRNECLYVCREADIDIWVKKLIRGNYSRCKIYKLSLDGEIFWADAYYFDDHEDADVKKYWNGCSPENPDVDSLEGLFVGIYTAKECVTRI